MQKKVHPSILSIEQEHQNNFTTFKLNKRVVFLQSFKCLK